MSCNSKKSTFFSQLYGNVCFVSLSDPAPQIHHGKVSQISNLGPIFIRQRPRRSLRIARNHEEAAGPRSPGPGRRACPWAQALDTSFVIPVSYFLFHVP